MVFTVVQAEHLIHCSTYTGHCPSDVIGCHGF